MELPLAPHDVELQVAQLWAAGALGVWEQADRLVAWFPDPVADLGPDASWSEEPDRDWQAAWKATIGPVRAGRFVVVPSWLAGEHAPHPDECTIVLDPAQAFGSGHHPTTALCLEALDRLPLSGSTVADVGCGTGVLAIAAARCGAEVVAVDLDPVAVEVTRDNARRNGVEVDARVGSVDALAGPADVVVANLVTDVLVALAPALTAAARRHLVVSGIASARIDRVRDALAEAGASRISAAGRDGWVALVARTG